MPKYKVKVTRTVKLSLDVIVNALDSDDAVERAEEMANVAAIEGDEIDDDDNSIYWGDLSINAMVERDNCSVEDEPEELT